MTTYLNTTKRLKRTSNQRRNTIMPMPVLPEGIDAALRQFARQAQLNSDEILTVVANALRGNGAEQPDIGDEDPDVVEADASVNVPDEELDMHPETDLSSRMGPRRARKLAKVGTLREYQGITTASRRRRIRSAS